MKSEVLDSKFSSEREAVKKLMKCLVIDGGCDNEKSRKLPSFLSYFENDSKRLSE
jgi:hypothetical protein